MKLEDRKTLIARAKELMNDLSIDPIKALKMAEKEILEEQKKNEGE